MKKNKFYLILAVLTVSVFGQTLKAQSNKEELDFFQSIFGMEKKAIVTEFLGIDSSNPFWAIYDEYETKRKELGKERVNALLAYTENYGKMDDAKIDATIASMIDLRKKTDKLTDTYYKKVKKVSGSKIAGQFFQLEGYFTSQIRATIMEEIPYIGEFDK